MVVLKGIGIFIIVMAVLVSLTGNAFSLDGFLYKFSGGFELLEYSSISMPVFPAYSPSSDSNAVDRIAYFFTDYLPDLGSFIGDFFSESSKLIYYPLINTYRVTKWFFTLLVE